MLLIQLLFLIPMIHKLSHRNLLILIAYLVCAIGLTILIIRKQAVHPEPVFHHPQKKVKDPDKLGPQELFFLDRNYPATNVQKDVYQNQLKQAIMYDKNTARSHRGLNYPWSLEGPGNIGGRINTLAVHPTNADIILLGYANGGIYRTEDGGSTWTPVFDDQPSLSIGHISFDPHDPDRVWAATGDVNISGYYFLGSGIYRSDDQGIHWSYMGLGSIGVLSKVMVDPNNPQIIYAGSMGYPSHPGAEKGIFRSSNGGNSWEKTLTIDDSTGIIDMVTDPLHPGHVFAAAWTRIRSNTRGVTVGPGTGLYKSEDYGATWANVTNGLPSDIHSRTSVEMSNDGTLFLSYIGALSGGECAGYVESLQHIYKSIDGGLSWDTIPSTPSHGVYCDLFGEFGWYFEVLKVNPENSMDMFLMGVDLIRTVDGGLSWFEAAPPWWTYEVHADKHDLVFAHDEIFVATDGGAYKTDINQFGEWQDIENIPSTQFYRTAWSPHTPDLYYGGAQDNGTTGGNATMFNEWPRIYGGDGFQPLFDPTEPDWIYVLTQNGSVAFSDDGGFDFRGLNKGLRGSRYWDMPFVMSSHDPKVLFCGSYKMFRINMQDSIREWKEISPDLTRGDTILGNRYPAITAIAQSGLDSMRIYAGTQDGLLWTTADGGLNWTNITDGTPGFFVTSISCSTVNPEEVIVTYSGYRDNNHHPYIYRSENAGAVWEPINAQLPMMGVNNLFILPGWNDAVLFAATDGGVYVTSDAGAKWERLGSNMPYMPVYDIDYNPSENTIIAASFSRGIMTFPVEELDLVSAVDPVSQDEPASVFNVYPTLFQDHLTIETESDDRARKGYRVAVYNIHGHRVQELDFADPGSKKMIPMKQSLPSGIYILQITMDQQLEYSGKILRI